MRIRLVLLAAGALLGSDAFACGDKFLVAARGTRFQRGPEPGRGYAVVVFAPQSSPLADRTRRERAEKALAQAGYLPLAVASGDELAASLKGRKAIVVAAPGDAGALESRLAPASLVVVDGRVSTDRLLDAVDAAVRRMARVAVAAPAAP